MNDPTAPAGERPGEPKPAIATTPTEPTPPQPRTPLHVPDEENELIEKPDTESGQHPSTREGESGDA